MSKGGQTERWRMVGHSVVTDYVLTASALDWYGRRADGRRWSIRVNEGGGATLIVTEPGGWAESHKSTHKNLSAAKRSAKDLDEPTLKRLDLETAAKRLRGLPNIDAEIVEFVAQMRERQGPSQGPHAVGY